MKTLLIIDMLNDFCLENGALYVGDQVNECIANVKEQLADFRESRNGVIYLCDTHQDNDSEFNLFPPHCIEGSHGECIIDELEPEGDDLVMIKQTYSGIFNNPALIEIFKDEKNEIHVCGLCTSICIMETVADLYKEDIYCHIVEKACCDIDKEAHEMAINRMKILFGAKTI